MSVIDITAPTEWIPTSGTRKSIFLAGGITDCENWQREAIRQLNGFPDLSAWALNPRRPDFDVNDPSAEDQQIEWEFRHLHRVDLILFWFPKSESVQPIAQYELGRYVALGKQVSVGADPEYLRARDVYKQLRLARNEIRVHDTLLATCRDARERLKA